MADGNWNIGGVMKAQHKRLDAKLLLAANIMVAEIRPLIPVDKGDLKGALDQKKVRDLHYRVFNDKEYAPDVEFGTKPHEIKAKPGKVLAFNVQAGSKLGTRKALYRNKKTGKLQQAKNKNTVIFATKVNHPGTKAQPFMRPGFRRAKAKIRVAFAKGGFAAVYGNEVV